MNRLRVFISLLCLLGTGILTTQAQNLIVQTIDNNENSKPLSTVQSLSFTNGSLFLHYKTTTAETFNIIDLRKLFFKDAAIISNVDTSDVDNNDDNDDDNASTGFKNTNKYTHISPNPAGNYITISNTTDNQSIITIYRMDGMKVLQTSTSLSTETIDISSLPKGIYLIRINNATTKFSKL